MKIHYLERSNQHGYLFTGAACHRVAMKVGNCTSDINKVTCGHCRRSVLVKKIKHEKLLQVIANMFKRPAELVKEKEE